MKNMCSIKKIILLLLCGLMMVPFTACGRNAGQGNDNNEVADTLEIPSESVPEGGTESLPESTQRDDADRIRNTEEPVGQSAESTEDTEDTETGTAVGDNIRILSSFVCGIMAGLLVRIFYRGKGFFNFRGFEEPKSRDTDPKILLRFLKNLGRNIKATGGGYFLTGIVLSALFQRYVPAETMTALFGGNEAFGVLMAATVGVPLYACGGGQSRFCRRGLRTV